MTPASPQPTTGGSVNATVAATLPPAWWAPGIALHERGRRPHRQPAAQPDDSADTFAFRVADLGLDTDAVHALREEPPAELAARVPRPAWVLTAERVVRAAEPVTEAGELGVTWRDAFTRVLAPFVDDAVRRITAGVPADASRYLDLPQVTESVGTTLGHHLVDLAARTLVTELHRWRTAGRLTGADSRARFLDFASAIAAPHALAELLTTYPVLARLLAQASTATATATLELLGRLVADRALVVDIVLGGGTDPGPVTALVPGRGDRHHGGRAVAFVDFADGSRVVYKPRDVTTQVRVGQFLDRLAAEQPDLCPRAVRTLRRSGYGWSEYVANDGLPDRAGADRFYRRQGALLALLHLLRATDMHYENVIASGEVPVLIDTETLFNAELIPSGTGDPATDTLAASVHRTALLPLMVVGEQGIADLSGLGGDRGGHCPSSVIDWLDAGTDRMRLTRRGLEMGGSANRPRLDGVDLDPGDHEPAMLAGFRQTYDTIAAHSGDFAVLVSACADLEVRVVTRPSWLYGTLLDETTHPDVLRDALDRDEAFSVLYAGRAANPLFAQLIGHEIAALWDGDVPLFIASAGSGRLRTPAGTPLPVSLPRSGVAAAIDTLAGLNEVDRTDQEWIISATLATRGGDPAHPTPAPITPAPASPVVHPDGLIAAACAVADRIVARAAGDERVNWLGLEAVDDRQWLVLPQGASLGSGYLGVAVFLAQLTSVTGIARYAEQARRAVADLPALVDTFTDRPDLVEAAGWGGLSGLGGITYGLSRLGLLLDDSTLLASARRLVPLAGLTAAESTDPGWANGLAGCLAAMDAVRADLNLDAAGDVARRCADRLAELDLAELDTDQLSTGFADGLAGIGWALTTCGPAAGHREAGRRAAALVSARAAAPTELGGWCRGGAGLALTGAIDVAAVAEAPVRRDLCLCHGELGVIEVLSVLTEPTGALRRRTGQVLEILRRHGPVCGVPGNVATPGLLTGLAGIGYGLLRQAAPNHVPSVLLLRPGNE